MLKPVACMLSLAVLAAPAFSHHSGSMFDQTKTVTLSGTVAEFQWSSPHAWIELMVPGAAGKQQEWSIEMGGPSVLFRKGWRPHTLKPGDRITVKIHPVRSTVLGGSFLSAKRADGTALHEG